MAAWETMIREHGPAVWRTAYRLLGNRTDADDCLQEALVAAVVASRRGPVENWPALLQKLAVARGVDRLRRRGRDVLHRADELGPWQSVSPDASPEAAAQNGEMAGTLRLALARLPSRQAEIMCLRYLSDLSYQEISQQLRISVRHVGVILSRAREKLREVLRKRGVDHG